MKKRNKKAPHDNPEPGVALDQRIEYDSMRGECPIKQRGKNEWTLFRHQDIMRVLLDPDTFSNKVSHRLSVPNGMDPPEHTVYRNMIEPYFSQKKVDTFAPACRQVITKLIRNIRENKNGNAVSVEIMDELASPYAARIQCEFLGWDTGLDQTLISLGKKKAMRLFVIEIVINSQNLLPDFQKS